MRHRKESNHLLTIPHGILLINKPRGWKSFDIVRYFQHLTKMRKIGHSGTLDEQATGLMILAFGRDTPRLTHLLTYPKTYVFRMVFGASSETLDAAGKHWSFSSVSDKLLTEELLQDTIKNHFTGEIDQIPPMYSCLKKEGKRLHEYARKGIELDLEPRKITLYDMQLVALVKNSYYPQAILEVNCSSGTYIRSLVRDLAQKIGHTAYLASLCRTRIGPYHFSRAVPPQAITSIEELKHYRLPAIDIRPL